MKERKKERCLSQRGIELWKRKKKEWCKVNKDYDEERKKERKKERSGYYFELDSM